GDYRRRTVLQRCIRNEQQCKQHRTHHCKKGENWHWGVPRGWLQKEMPFRIIKPTKIAVSDRPNICVALCSFVLSTCAVARSFVFVMTSIPTSQFCHQQGNAKARRGGHASIRREWSTIERGTKLYVSTIRR